MESNQGVIWAARGSGVAGMAAFSEGFVGNGG